MRFTACFLLPLALLLAACDRMQLAENMQKQAEIPKGPEVPGIGDTVLEQLEAAEKQGEYVKAARILEPFASGTEVKDERLVLRYADALRKGERYEDAIRHYNRLLALKPDNLDALEGKALCLVAQGTLDEADPLLTRVMEKDAARWRTLNAAGISFSLRNRINEALQYYKAALQVAPNNVTVLNNIGLAMAFNRDFDHAVTFLDRARTLAGNDERLKKRLDLNLSLVHGIAGNMEQAEKFARPHLSEPALYNNMGLYASLSKNEALARSYLNMALTGSKVYYDKAWKNLEALNKPVAGEKSARRAGGKSVKVPAKEPAKGEKSQSLGTVSEPSKN